jgi:hypothetical protein
MLLLMPFTSTPVGNQLASDSTALAWIGWVSRNVLNGGDLGYVAGVVFGAAIYALLRTRLGAAPRAAARGRSRAPEG